MAEYITNGTFDSNLTGWTNWSSDVEFVYDATGASHDGGSALAKHEGAANLSIRFAMYQTFTISNTSDIETAVVNAWIQLDDASSAQHDEVDLSTARFRVQLKPPASGDNWKSVNSHTYTYGNKQNDDLSSDTDVKSILQTGGDGTWGVYISCDIARADVGTGDVAWFKGWFDDLSLDIIFGASNTVSGTISMSGSISQEVNYAQEISSIATLTASISQKVNFAQTISGTVNLTALTLGGGSKTLKTDYKYFLGTADGTTHEHSEDFKGDAGVIIPCQYVTKDTDFTSQDQQSNDQWKTVYAVKVFYEDMSADTNIVVAISVDGGYTYPVSQSQTLGNGDKTRKDATFYFVFTGQFFRFKISSGSASTTFKFLGMEVEYADAGQHWVVA